MSKIPTAKEYFAKRYNELGIYHADDMQDEDSVIAIEYAKLHVKAALEAARQNAKLKYQDFGDGDLEGIDAQSILSAYPETNIQ